MPGSNRAFPSDASCRLPASGRSHRFSRVRFRRARHVARSRLAAAAAIIIAVGASLSDVVAQFNRYNIHKLSIADEGTGTIRISGTFRAQNSAAFVRVMSDGFGVRARSLGDETILSK